jgi:hypothetical protein
VLDIAERHLCDLPVGRRGDELQVEHPDDAMVDQIQQQLEPLAGYMSAGKLHRQVVDRPEHVVVLECNPPFAPTRRPTGSLDSIGGRAPRLPLARRSRHVRGRDPEKARGLEERGVRVRQGDLDDAATLAHAFEGASQVLIVSERVFWCRSFFLAE